MLKKTLKYSLFVLISYALTVYAFYYGLDLGKAEIYGFSLAGSVNLLNFVSAMFFVERSLSKSNHEFIKAFVRSTIVRVVILVGIFFTIVLIMPLNHFVFSVSFVILYFLFQMLEIYILHTNMDAGNK